MKRTIYMICIIALLSAIIVITPAAARTWYVDDDGGPGIDFTDIRAATLDNTDLSSGDTVFVYNGTYGWFAIEMANIKVIGEGADVVTVDCGGSGIFIGQNGNGAPGCVLYAFSPVNSDSGLGIP